MTARWRGTIRGANSIHTPRSLATRARQLDRFNALLRLMEGGCALHCTNTPSGQIWTLTDGRRLTAPWAERLIAHPNVVPVGDALFEGLSQTWRWTE
jgi:hypothetical protein